MTPRVTLNWSIFQLYNRSISWKTGEKESEEYLSDRCKGRKVNDHLPCGQRCLSACTNIISMKTFDIRYSSLNRILLILIGLWPYQRSKLTRLQSSLFLGNLMTYIIFKVHVYFWITTRQKISRNAIYGIFLIFVLLGINRISYFAVLNNYNSCSEFSVVRTEQFELQNRTSNYSNLSDFDIIRCFDRFKLIAKLQNSYIVTISPYTHTHT